ncbi:radical SAM protein [Deltaproteobacteria bacterium TL4]
MTLLAPIMQKTPLTQDSHERLSAEGLLVYPVLSRRSEGISIGINLNPDKVCNFDCVYCQVDRRSPFQVPEINLPKIISHLEWYLDKIQKQGGHWEGIPVKDIAFSGDGEPTTSPYFPQVVPEVIQLRDRYHLEHLKLVLISNATCFHLPRVWEVLPAFFQGGGVIWAKLDAGDEASFSETLRTQVPFHRILSNIKRVGQKYPITIQSCFMQRGESSFQEDSLKPYIETIQELVKAGTQIQRIQAYTIARVPAESFVSAWSNAVMDKIGEILNFHLRFPVKVYYGTKY